MLSALSNQPEKGERRSAVVEFESKRSSRKLDGFQHVVGEILTMQTRCKRESFCHETPRTLLYFWEASDPNNKRFGKCLLTFALAGASIKGQGQSTLFAINDL